MRLRPYFLPVALFTLIAFLVWHLHAQPLQSAPSAATAASPDAQAIWNSLARPAFDPSKVAQVNNLV
ncbi:MAG TPA: hypothetical protein VFO34_10025, partial [Candidatus Acidoferrales bacterium]|nr:hypothetical protein [Candidatus Acidoferrales bacterium]